MSAICVMGLGYIGLPVASMLASQGHDVVGCDVNAKVVESINAGHAHFFEPDLDMLLTAAVSTGRLRAQTTPAEADYFIIAVPTPIDAEKRPDMSFVESATAAIAPVLRKGSTIILESTSPVGATEKIAATLAGLRPDLAFPRYQTSDQQAPDVHVAHCPERILPGRMLTELVNNDRIIGGVTPACARKAAELYRPAVNGDSFLTDSRTAELVKLVENASRDVNIALVNELSTICDRLGVDVWRAIALANKHPRVNLLQPGVGVGGHCIAVDPWFIVALAPDEARLIRTAREVNDAKPHHVVAKIAAHAERLREPVVACLGLAYKADIEDLRESPAVEVAEALAGRAGMRVLACEPNIKELPRALSCRANVELAPLDEAIARADIVAVLVGHSQFKSLDPSVFLSKIMVDVVGLLSPDSAMGKR